MKVESHIERIRLTCFAATAFVALAAMSSALAQTPSSSTDKAATKAPMTQPMPMEKNGSTMKAAPGMSAGSSDMRASMMGMMKNMESMQTTGDTDRDFASMMKMHHQGAIDMAQLELKSGKDAKMRTMAKRIIDAQQKEIKEFDQWLDKRK